jgi:hypothetical protein
MKVRRADAIVFDMVNALLLAYRPSECADCGRPLGLVASWGVTLAADAQTVVTACCPECVVIPSGPRATNAD